MKLTLDVARKLHVLTLGLENDGAFHRAFTRPGLTKAELRLLVRDYASGKTYRALVQVPGTPQNEFETAPGYLYREAIREYLCKSWGYEPAHAPAQGPEKGWRKAERPVVEPGSDDAGNYFVVVESKASKAPTQGRTTDDYSSLPDGTILHTRSQGDYIKGPHPKAAHVKPCVGRPVFAWKVGDESLTHPSWIAATPEGSASACDDEGRDWDIVGFTFAQDQIDAEIAAPRADPEHPLYLQEANNHLTNASEHFARLATSLKEIAMNKQAIIDITTKTLVNGVDIKELSDSAVYDLIASQEAAIAELEKINAKPKKLVAEIAKRKDGINALVAYLDSKE